MGGRDCRRAVLRCSNYARAIDLRNPFRRNGIPNISRQVAGGSGRIAAAYQQLLPGMVPDESELSVTITPCLDPQLRWGERHGFSCRRRHVSKRFDGEDDCCKYCSLNCRNHCAAPTGCEVDGINKRSEFSLGRI
jgi:hypothetical protein